MYIKSKEDFISNILDNKIEECSKISELILLERYIIDSNLNEAILTNLLNKVNYVKNMLFKKYNKKEIQKDVDIFINELLKMKLTNYHNIKKILFNKFYEYIHVHKYNIQIFQ